MTLWAWISKRLRLCLAGSILLLAPLASAQTSTPSDACETVTDLWQSAIMIRTVAQMPGRIDAGSRDTLQTRINTLSLSALTDASNDLQTEIHRRALERFQNQARVKLSESGASQSLADLLTPDLFTRLQALEKRLGCVAQDTLDELDFQAPAQGPSGPGSTADSLSTDATLSQRSGGLSAGTLSSGQSVSSPLTASDFGALALMIAILIGLPYWLYYRRNSASYKAREVRHILSQSVTVRINERPLQLTLVDLSMNGFKLRHDGRVEGTGSIDMALGGDWHNGHIRWRNDGFIGGNFVHPLPPATMIDVIDKAVETTSHTMGEARL